MSSNNNDIISTVSLHTIKKFELIEAYTQAWARKLLEYGRTTGNCKGIVFIDCMSNSGMYVNDETGETVEGTPIRVARVISAIMREQNYQKQHAWLYFNDLSQDKINELAKHMPLTTHNFHISLSARDGNDLIKEIGKNLSNSIQISYLLIYDPYQATIDWEALLPFIRNWGEVIINHMVSDSIRAMSQVKRSSTISKYEQTYLAKMQELVGFGSDRAAFEQRVQEIITAIKGTDRKRYYIASYPFFNSKNTVVYNLLHCTSSLAGFKLYKSTAWSTFGGQSSLKKIKVSPEQLAFDPDSGNIAGTTSSDANCYFVQDIAKFVADTFAGRSNVPLKEIWDAVNEHPIFPSDLYKNEIKDMLREYGCTVHRSSIDFC